jgi:hypothetical protein
LHAPNDAYPATQSYLDLEADMSRCRVVSMQYPAGVIELKDEAGHVIEQIHRAGSISEPEPILRFFLQDDDADEKEVLGIIYCFSDPKFLVTGLRAVANLIEQNQVVLEDIKTPRE